MCHVGWFASRNFRERGREIKRERKIRERETRYKGGKTEGNRPSDRWRKGKDKKRGGAFTSPPGQLK
jgi:hypothetical protein